MLEHIDRQDFVAPVFRYVNQGRFLKTLSDLGLDADEADEMIQHLKSHGLVDSPEDVLNAPFELKPFATPYATRFSDGSIRIFYSALEFETAEQEVLHWFMKPLVAGSASTSRVVYYRRAECSFSGMVKDLRGSTGIMPFLVADNSYRECNAVGYEANAAGLDGVLTTSARREAGTNLPVFVRASLSNPQLGEYRAFEYNPATSAVAVRPVP